MLPTSANQGREPGCESYVTGYGLQNFCAAGGGGRMGTSLGNWYGKYNQNRHSAIGCDEGGGCYCQQGSWYCFDNSCSTGSKSATCQMLVLWTCNSPKWMVISYMVSVECGQENLYHY